MFKWLSEISNLDLYKIIFIVTLLFSEFLFTRPLVRRSRFYLRAALCSLACIAIAAFFPIFFYNAVYASLMFFVLFVITIAALKICYDESIKHIIFFACLAYAVEHLSYGCFDFLITATGINDLASYVGGGGGTVTWEIYGSDSVKFTDMFTSGAAGVVVISYTAFFLGCYSVIYGLAFAVFSKKFKRGEEVKISGKTTIFLSALIIVSDIVLNTVVVYNSYSIYNKTYYLVSGIYNILCCIIVIALLFSSASNAKLKSDVDYILYLLKEKETQYALSKENINIINEKCHNLRHQIRYWGRMQGAAETEIAEAEKSIAIYDSSVKTGNDALDIILTEKTLFCVNHSIKMTCCADGRKLSFISESDLYSLFGNAIENAIEAVMKISDEERRVISINIKSVNSMISVSVKNYYEGKVSLKNGIPQTIKEDTNYHGFGVRSIKRIVEKYGGDLQISAENGVFCLNMLFNC